MKKLVYLIMVLFLLSGCTEKTPVFQETNLIQAKVESVKSNNTNDYEYSDLVYRSYENGVKLEKGAEFYIFEPNIKFQDENKVSIWVNSLDTNQSQKIMDYTYTREISFYADKSGTYVIYAIIENKDSTSFLDLTDQGRIGVSTNGGNTHGIIPLK